MAQRLDFLFAPCKSFAIAVYDKSATNRQRLPTGREFRPLTPIPSSPRFHHGTIPRKTLMIRTFLFDMGNVLVHFCHDRMCSQIGELCGKSGPEIRAALIESELQFKFERGWLSEDEFQAVLQRLLDASFERDELFRAGSDIFQANSSIVPVLKALKTAGHRLVLLSNTSAPHLRFVRENYEVLEYFDDFVLSYEVGAVKPDAAIFEAALRKIDCPPEECFYTDDIEEYVITARKFGLRAEVFTDTENLLIHLVGHGVQLLPTDAGT
jgi:HAD superfamily hydrolase (TIGR01549 family)